MLVILMDIPQDARQIEHEGQSLASRQLELGPKTFDWLSGKYPITEGPTRLQCDIAKAVLHMHLKLCVSSECKNGYMPTNSLNRDKVMPQL